MSALPTPCLLQAYHVWADHADMVLTRCDQDGDQYQPILPVIGMEYLSTMEVSLVTFFFVATIDHLFSYMNVVPP